MRSLAVMLAFAAFAAEAAPDVPLADLNTGLSQAEDGKVLRVRGVIDACLSDSCSICPDWEKASRQDEIFRRSGCLSVMSWKDSNARLLYDELYRFTDVEITGQFHFQSPDEDGTHVLCLDFRRCQQSGFEDVTINTLYERRPIQRVPNYNPADAIVPISAEDDAALRKLFWNDPDFSLVYLDGPETALRTYMRPPKDRGALVEGWLCFARKSVVVNSDEAFPWPTTYRAISLRSPANPYRCRLARKEKSGWRIVRELQKLPVYGLD